MVVVAPGAVVGGGLVLLKAEAVEVTLVKALAKPAFGQVQKVTLLNFI